MVSSDSESDDDFLSADEGSDLEAETSSVSENSSHLPQIDKTSLHKDADKNILMPEYSKTTSILKDTLGTKIPSKLNESSNTSDVENELQSNDENSNISLNPSSDPEFTTNITNDNEDSNILVKVSFMDELFDTPKLLSASTLSETRESSLLASDQSTHNNSKMKKSREMINQSNSNISTSKISSVTKSEATCRASYQIPDYQEEICVVADENDLDQPDVTKLEGEITYDSKESSPLNESENIISAENVLCKANSSASSHKKQLPSALPENTIVSQTSSFDSPTEESVIKPITVDSSSSDLFVNKPMKTSKIGLKKPREKLGERLGARRLGTRTSKPLEGISCESLKKTLPPPKSTVKSENKGLKTEDSWENIDASAVSNFPEQSSGNAGGGGNWGSAWGGWGSSLITAAASLSQEVGRGVGSVVELMEEGIGVPSPEQLAREQHLRQTAAEQQRAADGTSDHQQTEGAASFGGLGLGGLSSLVSGVSGVLESAGSKVVSGGLDTLELIGRRTMDVLQDTDPSLRAKKNALVQRVNKPNLSAVLREARELATANPAPSEDSCGAPPTDRGRLTFARVWDGSAGPAHLEALALMARQCSSNRRTLLRLLTHHLRTQVTADNDQLQELSEVDEASLTESDSVFPERVAATIGHLKLPLHADAITQCWSELSTLSSQYESSDDVDLLAGESEAEVLGRCVALVERLVAVAHKAAELCLTEEQHDPYTLAYNYKELVQLGGCQMEGCADAVCTALSASPSLDQMTPLITNIYLQVCEGSSCLQQSLVHLITTLQTVQVQRLVNSLQ